MTDSPSPIRAAADAYRRSLQSFRAGLITADQHRADNRLIKQGLTDAQWERAKFWAIHTLGA